MRRLAILPDKASYSADMGASFVSSSLDGPASNFGARPRGAADEVQCSWSLTPGEYAYMRAFFRTAQSQGSLPFTAALAVDGAPLEDYVAVFVPGSFGLRGISGEVHTVSARLLASKASTAAEVDFDETVAMLLSEYGTTSDTTQNLGLLDELVNEDLPA